MPTRANTRQHAPTRANTRQHAPTRANTPLYLTLADFLFW